MSDMVEIARGQGFTAIKVPSSASRKCPTGRLSICSAMRELVGDDITLGIDPGYRWIHWQALWVLNRLDEHRIFFAEARCATTTLRAVANSQLVRRC